MWWEMLVRLYYRFMAEVQDDRKAMAPGQGGGRGGEC